MKQVCRLGLVLDETLNEIRSTLSNLRISGAEVIKTVGNSVLSAHCPGTNG